MDLDPPPDNLRHQRLIELLLVFGALPAALTLWKPRYVVLPALIITGLACAVVLLRDPRFDRRLLLEAPGGQREVRSMAVGAAVASLALLGCAALLAPGPLFDLPRTRPTLWLAVLVLYPVLSVYPQELIFRAFFFHRYTVLFPRTRARILASAAAFALAHLVLRNVPALLGSFAGGLMFARTYARSRSLVLAALEHALLGDILFTVGFGAYFYEGAQLVAWGRF